MIKMFLSNTFDSIHKIEPQTTMKLVFASTISVFLNFHIVTGQCIINPDSAANWPQWPPIITNQVGDLIIPTGVEDNRQITIESDQVSNT